MGHFMLGVDQNVFRKNLQMKYSPTIPKTADTFEQSYYERRTVYGILKCKHVCFIRWQI